MASLILPRLAHRDRPHITIFGIFGNLRVLTPTSILNSYSPFYASPPTTETIFLLDATIGFLAGLTFTRGLDGLARAAGEHRAGGH